MVRVITAVTTQSSHQMGKAIMRHSPTMVEKVLTLPLQPAAMTRPLPTATSLRPVTANSRVRTIITAQAGIRPHSTKMSIQAVTRSLSARGSRNFPKSLTWL